MKFADNVRLAGKKHKTDMYTGSILWLNRTLCSLRARRLWFNFSMSGKTHGHETRDPKPTKNYCFACGPDNPEGMRLKFTLDEERRTFVCHFTSAEALHRTSRPLPRRHHRDDPRRRHGQGEQAAQRGRGHERNDDRVSQARAAGQASASRGQRSRACTAGSTSTPPRS